LLAYLEEHKQFPNPIPIKPWNREALYGPEDEINRKAKSKKQNAANKETAVESKNGNGIKTTKEQKKQQ
jgi:hypothetical protein